MNLKERSRLKSLAGGLRKAPIAVRDWDMDIHQAKARSWFQKTGVWTAVRNKGKEPANLEQRGPSWGLE